MFDLNTAPGTFAECPDCGHRLAETVPESGSLAFVCPPACPNEPLALADVYLEHDERATVREGALFIVTVPDEYEED